MRFTLRRLTCLGLLSLLLAGSTSSAATTDPLKGHWDTGKVPMSDVRAAVLRAGYTNAEFNSFLRSIGLRSSPMWETKFVFYRVVLKANAPYVKITTWDPRKPMPGDGDHGPYTLLTQRRVAITSADPGVNKYRFVFGYRIAGKTLTLRALSITDPTRTKAQLRIDKLALFALAAAPLTKTK